MWGHFILSEWIHIRWKGERGQSNSARQWRWDNYNRTGTESRGTGIHQYYKAEGEIVLEAGKKLLGEKALEKDQFTFELRDENGELIDSVKNDADGKVTFKAIGYTQDNIYEKDEETGAYKPREKTSYKYTIREQIPEGAEEIDKNLYFYKGYAYDGTVYTITVELKDNGDGKGWSGK